jgi:hypothetical protein
MTGTPFKKKKMLRVRKKGNGRLTRDLGSSVLRSRSHLARFEEVSANSKATTENDHTEQDGVIC